MRPRSPATMVPAVEIGRYKVESEIARGGMALVYRAVDPRMKRHVAIKALLDRWCRDKKIRRRFHREVVAVAKLEHATIVPVYDVGEDDGILYFVMRYMAGGTLLQRMSAGPLPLAEVAGVVTRVAEALDAAHAQGVIHRDLKPANVLFDEGGVAYLSDFGIAKVFDMEQITETHAVIGTPAYMSPEQADGKRLDRRADVYALAGMTFHALTGRRPFEADHPFALAVAHAREPVPSAREHVPTLPRGIDGVFQAGMAKWPGDRHDTAGAFADHLVKVASGRWALERLSGGHSKVPKTDGG